MKNKIQNLVRLGSYSLIFCLFVHGSHQFFASDSEGDEQYIPVAVAEAVEGDGDAGGAAGDDAVYVPVVGVNAVLPVNEADAMHQTLGKMLRDIMQENLNILSNNRRILNSDRFNVQNFVEQYNQALAKLSAELPVLNNETLKSRISKENIIKNAYLLAIQDKNKVLAMSSHAQLEEKKSLDLSNVVDNSNFDRDVPEAQFMSEGDMSGARAVSGITVEQYNIQRETLVNQLSQLIKENIKMDNELRPERKGENDARLANLEVQLSNISSLDALDQEINKETDKKIGLQALKNVTDKRNASKARLQEKKLQLQQRSSSNSSSSSSSSGAAGAAAGSSSQNPVGSSAPSSSSSAVSRQQPVDKVQPSSSSSSSSGSSSQNSVGSRGPSSSGGSSSSGASGSGSLSSAFKSNDFQKSQEKIKFDDNVQVHEFNYEDHSNSRSRSITEKLDPLSNVEYVWSADEYKAGNPTINYSWKDRSHLKKPKKLSRTERKEMTQKNEVRDQENAEFNNVAKPQLSPEEQLKLALEELEIIQDERQSILDKGGEDYESSTKFYKEMEAKGQEIQALDPTFNFDNILDLDLKTENNIVTPLILTKINDQIDASQDISTFRKKITKKLLEQYIAAHGLEKTLHDIDDGTLIVNPNDKQSIIKILRSALDSSSSAVAAAAGAGSSSAAQQPVIGAASGSSSKNPVGSSGQSSSSSSSSAGSGSSSAAQQPVIGTSSGSSSQNPVGLSAQSSSNSSSSGSSSQSQASPAISVQPVVGTSSSAQQRASGSSGSSAEEAAERDRQQVELAQQRADVARRLNADRQKAEGAAEKEAAEKIESNRNFWRNAALGAAAVGTAYYAYQNSDQLLESANNLVNYLTGSTSTPEQPVSEPMQAPVAAVPSTSMSMSPEAVQPGAIQPGMESGNVIVPTDSNTADGARQINLPKDRL